MQFLTCHASQSSKDLGTSKFGPADIYSIGKILHQPRITLREISHLLHLGRVILIGAKTSHAINYPYTGRYYSKNLPDQVDFTPYPPI